MATKAANPGRGVASAVTHAVPTGPSRGPSTVFTWAAFTPVPTNDSPIIIRLTVLSRPPMAAARPGAHVGERFVDFREPVSPAHQPPKRQPALGVQAQDHRHVDGGPGRAIK